MARQRSDLITLVAAAAIFAGACLLVTAELPAQSAVTLAPVLGAREAHAAALAGQVVLVDIRTPGEWRATGVPASGHAITMHQAPEAFLREIATATGGSKSRPIALICATGNRSAHMQAILRQAGYADVADVAEGMSGGRRGGGWIKAGLPVRTWSASR
jgi:rhodanese-related sulfurtransferase